MRWLITGGTGTIGRAVASALHPSKNHIYVMSRDDTKQCAMKMDLPDAYYIIGDVTRLEDCERAMLKAKPDRVIHCAALKHVPACEENPEFATRVNVGGTINMLRASYNNSEFTLISTDKAVHPVSVLGFTKALAERHTLEMSGSIVRFGNVMGSRGSLLAIAKRQIREHGHLLVTHKDMVRYWITDKDAAISIIRPINRCEIRVPEMKERLVVNVLKEYFPKAKIKFTEPRFGEKMREELRWEWEK